MKESRRLLGGHTTARTARSTHATIFVVSFASALRSARDGGFFADFGRSNLTLMLTPMARPLCTAVFTVTLAFDGTRVDSTRGQTFTLELVDGALT